MTYDLPRTLYGFAFLDQSIRTEKHNTDLTGLEIHAHALDPRCEPAHVSERSGTTYIYVDSLDKLFCLDIVHAMHTGNAVPIVFTKSVLRMR